MKCFVTSRLMKHFFFFLRYEKSFASEFDRTYFYFSSPTQSTSGASQLQSPEAVKISCPICLDDDKTVSFVPLRKHAHAIYRDF